MISEELIMKHREKFKECYCDVLPRNVYEKQ